MPAKGYRIPISERLARRSETLPNGCVVWTGVISNKGYGVLKLDTVKRAQAHRLNWIEHNGSIPEGMCVLHRCDNPACFNIKHLFLGTKGDNNSDRHSKGRSRNQHTGPLSAELKGL